MTAFQFFYPIFCGFSIQFKEAIYKFDTFSIQNNTKTNMPAFLAKYTENRWYFQELDTNGGA